MRGFVYSQVPDIRAGLYLVATPIGTASDISIRAINLIANANVLIAEDTRNLLKLMKIHNIKLDGRMLLSYHDHNGSEQRPKVLSILKSQKSVVFVSDAGTPLIADPGYRLVSEAITRGFYVSCAPGACAVLAALTISGLPTDKFFFGGFIPTKTQAKRQFFLNYSNLPATLVFYESASRLSRTLDELCEVCDNERKVVVCRELTKKFEDIRRGTLIEVANYFSTFSKVKGEIVLLLSPAKLQIFGEKEVNDNLIDAIEYMSLKDAVSFVSKRLSIPKKIVYARALSMKSSNPKFTY